MNSRLTDRSRILFVRTPRYLWPFTSTRSAFWPPLGFCSLAGTLRKQHPDLRVEILDCPALKIGWATLEKYLRQNPPDVLCIGEETVSSPEGLRLAGLMRAVSPRTIIVAGGVYFSYAIENSLNAGNIDYIVRGEGEQTLAELLTSLIRGEPEPDDIPGLAYRDGEEVTVTSPRAPVMDMDTLAWPAYDLLDIDAYGRNSQNHPRPACLEHSRGCIDSCSFCILWKHFGKVSHDTVNPCYRSKSPERTFEEVKWLVNEYGRKTIHFIDPTFNADPDWSNRFSDLMLSTDMDVQFTAWVRAEGVVRDEKLGILEKLVRSGLRQAYIGVERAEESDLSLLNKHKNDADVCMKACEIFRNTYPEVVTIATLLYGLPWESKKTLTRLRHFHYHLPADYAFHIPLAPNPGTDIREKLQTDGYRMSENFREYNFFTPVVETEHLSRRQLENFYANLLINLSFSRLRKLLNALRGKDTVRRRHVTRNLVYYGFKVGTRQLIRRMMGPLAKPPTLHAQKPSWYDS